MPTHPDGDRVSGTCASTPTRDRSGTRTPRSRGPISRVTGDSTATDVAPSSPAPWPAGERPPGERRQPTPTVDLDRRALEEALDEVEWERWVIADARGYAFVERLVREVAARDMVTPGQRNRLAGGDLIPA